MAHGKIYIGTSGWMYKDWGEKFYPKDLKEEPLAFLAREFPTVEVNSSFYHLPLASTFKKWHDETPEEFVFAVKLSRYITHRNLSARRQPLYRFLSHAKRLGEKLGPTLIQLPPRKKFDEEWFAQFLNDIEQASARANVRPRFALEPRHVSWMEGLKKVRALVRSFPMALVFPDSASIPSVLPEDENLTSDFVYVRFHGPEDFAASPYGSDRLRPWAKRAKAWQAKGLDVFCYFNNDQHGYAIDDARALKQLLG